MKIKASQPLTFAEKIREFAESINRYSNTLVKVLNSLNYVELSSSPTRKEYFEQILFVQNESSLLHEWAKQCAVLGYSPSEEEMSILLTKILAVEDAIKGSFKTFWTDDDPGKIIISAMNTMKALAKGFVKKVEDEMKSMQAEIDREAWYGL